MCFILRSGLLLYCFCCCCSLLLFSSFFTIQNSLSSSNNQLMIEDGKWVWAHKKTKKLIHTRTSTSFMNKIQNSETSFPFSLYLSHLLYSRCIWGFFYLELCFLSINNFKLQRDLFFSVISKNKNETRTKSSIILGLLFAYDFSPLIIITTRWSPKKPFGISLGLESILFFSTFSTLFFHFTISFVCIHLLHLFTYATHLR